MRDTTGCWTRLRGGVGVGLWVALSASCAPDGVLGSDGEGSTVNGPAPGPSDAGGGGAGAAGGGTLNDAAVPESPCDMTGLWIAEQHTVSTAIGADQRATNYYYYQIRQEGDRFTIEKGLNCGLIVQGTTSVTLGDATLEALAPQESAGLGRQGTFKPAADGKSCEFQLDRSYNLRAANKAEFLTNHWKIGDPPKPLSEFPSLPKTPPGMEDWDGDGKDGFTLKTGLGQRYVTQRDWNEHSGTAPMRAVEFGGEGAITVTWDSQEAVSDQTDLILRTGSTPKGDGWARYARADGRLTVVETGDRPVLTTCRNVQSLARQLWPSN